MARARNIKPGLFDNEILGEADPILTVLFIGLWTMADREGRLEDRPKRIRKTLFGYRDGIDIDSLLDELVAMGFLNRYNAEGLAVLQVVNFAKHQNPHCKEAKSELPAPCNAAPLPDPEPASDKPGASTVQAPENPEPTGLIPDSLNLIPDSGSLREDSSNPVHAPPPEKEHAELVTVPQAANEKPQRGVLRKSARERLHETAGRPEWFGDERFDAYCDSHEHQHGKQPSPFALPNLFAGMVKAVTAGTPAETVVAEVVAGGWKRCDPSFSAFGSARPATNHTGFADRDYLDVPDGWNVAGGRS